MRGWVDWREGGVGVIELKSNINFLTHLRSVWLQQDNHVLKVPTTFAYSISFKIDTVHPFFLSRTVCYEFRLSECEEVKVSFLFLLSLPFAQTYTSHLKIPARHSFERYLYWRVWKNGWFRSVLFCCYYAHREQHWNVCAFWPDHRWKDLAGGHPRLIALCTICWRPGRFAQNLF